MAESGGPPVAETKGHLPNGLYILTNNLSRTALDLYEGNSNAGTRCVVHARNTDHSIDHQLWIIRHDESSNTYTIRNLRGGTYLDLQGGKSENGSQVTGNPRSLADGSRRNQEWRIVEQVPDQYTIQSSATNTYLEISGGNISNGTSVTCSARADDAEYQLWTVEHVSRTTQEIKAILASWKPDLLKHLFQPHEDDAEYFVLPYELRKKIWTETKLQSQTVRKRVFDYDDFVIKAKDAIRSWARDRLRIDEYSILCGVVYGKARRGPKAYNWYLSNDMHDLIFFDPQTGLEYTPAAVNALQFEPTFATL